MVDSAKPRSYYARDALRQEAEGERRRIEEQRRQLRQLRGHCVECGGPIERVAGTGFVMTTGRSLCQACHRQTHCVAH
jgi:hypothetical protein